MPSEIDATERSTSTETGFTIFRTEDGTLLSETDAMTITPFAAEFAADLEQARALGLADGEVIRLVFSAPGFSLTHVWFKKNYPLPLHSHDTECLYYIIGGNLRMGGKTLSRGDGFFIPRNMPYTYRPGPDGVELLEFRSTNSFDFKSHSDTPSFWRKAVSACLANGQDWKVARPPSPLS